MRFHLARLCTTWALSPAAGTSKLTGRSTPLKSSFRPVAGSTNSGADTRFKFSASDTYALEFTHLKMRVYRNGGLVLSGMSPFVLATPFTRDELLAIRFTQSADVMDMVHPNHKPQKLRRFDHDNWTISDAVLVPAIAAPASATATASYRTTASAGAGAATTTTTDAAATACFKSAACWVCGAGYARYAAAHECSSSKPC